VRTVVISHTLSSRVLPAARLPDLKWLCAPSRLTVVALSLAILLGSASLAQAAPDRREMRGREAFAAGRYKDALDIFVKLYAEKLHPNYLRNIGRCYQNLAEPDLAISSFREYLRKARSMTEAERVEIEGYIVEMEQLKKTQAAGSEPPSAGSNERTGERAPAPPSVAAAAPSAPAATTTVTLDRDALAARPTPPLPAAIDVSGRSAPAPGSTEEPPPVYARWWFWAIVGGVIAAGVGGAAVAGVFTIKKDAACGTPPCK
jgi:hypothetical protein